jgi:hypothetical protein
VLPKHADAVVTRSLPETLDLALYRILRERPAPVDVPGVHHEVDPPSAVTNTSHENPEPVSAQMVPTSALTIAKTSRCPRKSCFFLSRSRVFAGFYVIGARLGPVAVSRHRP